MAWIVMIEKLNVHLYLFVLRIVTMLYGVLVVSR